jgi:2-oxoglutarate dehydrogenase E2 component (dihydrolipoamide succinyltransferase)
MAKVELLMPKMGESIMEATILSWNKSVGDKVETDETILEIATDKVDSEIPSPTDGVISEILYEVDDVVEVGKVIAYIETEGEEPVTQASPAVADPVPSTESSSNGHQPGKPELPTSPQVEKVPYIPQGEPAPATASAENRFYSPLVKNIARKEGLSVVELDSIQGSGAHGRVTKRDVLQYLQHRQTNGAKTSIPDKIQPSVITPPVATPPAQTQKTQPAPTPKMPSFTSGQDEIIQMDRMRKLIADHMVMSKKTSAHVTSFVEADVTNIVNWRNAHKSLFQQQYGEKITFTPIFMEAVVQAIKDFPMINVSVDGDKIIKKRDINIGMATALPSGNLIVPVINNADHLNLVGLARQVNDLANRARNNQLKPEEISGGTFTLTNVGTFGNVMGTPIINQPQVAIMATGAIKKKPVVIETPAGDVIGIRSMMFLSLSYDHRVVDGFLGGSFLRRVADNLEAFDVNRPI